MNIKLASPGDIEKAIKELDKLKDSIEDKSKIFLERLASIGITALNAKISTISPFYKGEDLETSISKLYETENGWAINLEMSGSQSIFIEFGAGVIHNVPIHSSKHPKGEELGFTIGSYNPKSPNASSSSGWWYYDKWGEPQHTLGTPTFAPLYTSSLVMIEAIKQVALEVFS